MVLNMTNVTSFMDVMRYANEASENTFWIGMLFMIFAVLLLILIGYGFEVAVLVSAFLCLLIGSLLAYADFVAWYVVLIFAGIILFMFFVIQHGQSRTQ